MKIPILIGYLNVTLETYRPMPWTIRRAIKDVLFTDGKADTSKRIQAIKLVREMTGCGLRDAVFFTNKFFPKENRVLTRK